jgi:Flp pilus assembly protein TadG
MSFMQRLRRFIRANKGLAALEFAILAPVMVLLLFGSVELVDMLGQNSRVQNLAASLADVVSRDTEISDDEMTGIWSAMDVLMFPEDAAPVRARITSIFIEDATTARVVWSEGRNGMAALPEDSTVTLPSAAMMIPGTSVIHAEVEFPYTSPLGLVVEGNITMSHDAYRRSRQVDPIPRV